MKILKTAVGRFQLGGQIGPACWPFFDLFTVHEGMVELEFEGQTMTLAPQTCVLIPAFCAFQGKAIAAATLASIHHFELPNLVYPSGFEHLQVIAKMSLKPLSFQLNRDNFNDIKRSLALGQDGAKPREHVSLLSLILSGLHWPEFTNHQSKHQVKLQMVLEQMARQVGCDQSVAFWAAMANMSQSHFRSEFKHYTGRSVIKYLNQLKVDRACQLLEQDDYSIQQIALQLGFEDMGHFYRLFKQVTQQTPKVYRQLRQVWA